MTAATDEELQAIRLQLIDIKLLLAELIKAIGQDTSYTSPDE